VTFKQVRPEFLKRYGKRLFDYSLNISCTGKNISKVTRNVYFKGKRFADVRKSYSVI